MWFAYSCDRKGIHPQTHLAGFEGILQTDAYSGFDELSVSGKIREAACWDHARRKYYEIHASTPTDETQKLLAMIGEFYDIEADIRGKPTDERQGMRHEKSKPLLDAFEARIRAKLATQSRKSELAGAMYGLIGTCKLNGINPRTYLEYVLTHIADHVITRIDELLPWNVVDKLTLVSSHGTAWLLHRSR
ncbi:hypothetical protein WI92_23665 [Burkholderia vietnamiensis]|nr:hypothetical protein WI92_23665 [Burkholderia vietnamiensis]